MPACTIGVVTPRYKDDDDGDDGKKKNNNRLRQAGKCNLLSR